MTLTYDPYMTTTALNDFNRQWEKFTNNKDPLRRRDGIAFLMRFGESSVPCSRYGRRSSDCAEVAWRLAYVLAKETGDPITADGLEYCMSLVVNDHDDVAYMIRQYGHRMYR